MFQIIKFQFIKSVLSMAFLGLFFTGLASASGGYSGGGGGGYNNSGSSYKAKKVDQAYEYGKAIYNGRLADVSKFKVCLPNGDKKEKISRRLVKEFKGKSLIEFANNLFDCDKPETLISVHMTTDQFRYVLYYLNKRYKLKLSES